MYRILLIGTLCAACSKTGTPPSPDEIPETTSVSASTLTSGFATGVIHKSVDVSAFRITRHPITVAQYAQCVSAGGCASPSATLGECSEVASAPTVQLKGSTRTLDGALPITCVTSGEARAYCAWVGGTLPTEDQWLLAARGPSPNRYPWGTTVATCDQHPGAAWKSSAVACGGNLSDFAVGKHPSGASSAEVEDILLARNELLAVALTSSSPACRMGDACIVTGTLPGGIEGVASVTEPITRTASFRCVMEAQ